MSKKKEASAETPSQAKPSLTPKQIVMRVLGVGEAAAEGVLNRMGSKADELTEKYNSGQARDWIAEHNVKPPAAPVDETPAPQADPVIDQEPTQTL